MLRDLKRSHSCWGKRGALEGLAGDLIRAAVRADPYIQSALRPGHDKGPRDVSVGNELHLSSGPRVGLAPIRVSALLLESGPGACVPWRAGSWIVYLAADTAAGVPPMTS
jgi:hypothetical protein